MLRNSATSRALISTLSLLLSPPLALAQSADATIPPAMDARSGKLGVMPSFKFDILSFKPCDDTMPGSIWPVNGGDFLQYHCEPIRQLIYYAYITPEHPFLMSGEPGWVQTDRYEFVGKVAPEDADAFQKLDQNSKRMMMRGMLAEVLKLKLHPDPTPRSVYDLVVGKGELKLTPYKDDETNTLPNGRKVQGVDSVFLPDSTAYYQGETMSQFAEAVETRIGKQVINKTGLTDQYDFKAFMPIAHYNPNMPVSDDSPIPLVFAGVKALGLDLVPAKEITGALIIDHIERPPQD